MSNKQGAGFHGVDALKYAVLGGETTTVVPSKYVVGVSLSRQINKTQQHANNRNNLDQDFVTGCKNNPGGLPGLAVRTAGRYSCAWEWHRRLAPAY